MKVNDFDKIAFIYDRLARLIFGESIVKSQVFFLDKIPDHANVLILGGGTGWILEELFLLKPSTKVCYIEASAKMIALTKKKMWSERILFIHGTERVIPPQKFDVVITNFYFDLFSTESLERVVLRIKESIGPKAIWIATDFGCENWKHRTFLKLMYLFFKVTSNIEASHLPEWKQVLSQAGGTKVDSKFFYGNFIEAAVFQF